jgi:hypothetical protein
MALTLMAGHPDLRPKGVRCCHVLTNSGGDVTSPEHHTDPQPRAAQICREEGRSQSLLLSQGKARCYHVFYNARRKPSGKARRQPLSIMRLCINCGQDATLVPDGASQYTSRTITHTLPRQDH